MDLIEQLFCQIGTQFQCFFSISITSTAEHITILSKVYFLHILRQTLLMLCEYSRHRLKKINISLSFTREETCTIFYPPIQFSDFFQFIYYSQGGAGVHDDVLPCRVNPLIYYSISSGRTLSLGGILSQFLSFLWNFNAYKLHVYLRN